MTKGFNELWRVLDDYGILIFKWSNSEISFKQILKRFKEKPLFGQISSSRGGDIKTAWFTFMKIP